MAGELRKRFHRELAAVDEQLGSVLADITSAISTATKAFLAADADSAAILAGYRELATPLYREIRDRAESLMALQQPVADDLRYLLEVLGALRELELSASLTAEIARRGASGVAGRASEPARSLVARLGAVVSDMWGQVARCWRERASASSESLQDGAEEHDELLAALVAEIASGRWETPVTMEMTLVARCYERLGDHAAEIAHRIDRLVGFVAA